MNFSQLMHVPISAPEEAEPFSELPMHFLEDDLEVLGVEMPTEWDSALLDEWVNTDLLFTDDLMDGIENETSEPAAVAGSPDLIDLPGLWPQDSVPEPMDSRLNHGVFFDARCEVPELLIPRLDNQVETTQARRRIKCAEWDDKRPLIISLYIDQENSLSQTRKIMADDHDFHASYILLRPATSEKHLLTLDDREKAYKDKIREWRLVKNLKRRQIIYMLKIARMRRDEQGKATTFFYHGNRVPEAKMRRYSNAMTTIPISDSKVTCSNRVDVAYCRRSCAFQCYIYYTTNFKHQTPAKKRSRNTSSDQLRGARQPISSALQSSRTCTR
jgi:hypothetical protein